MKKKQIKVKHYCTDCYDSIRYNKENAVPLLERQLVIDLPKNFSVIDITEKVKQNINKQRCKKHPKSTVFIKYSFSHVCRL